MLLKIAFTMVYEICDIFVLVKNVDIVKESVLTLDKSLQKELNDSLESLGRQLASLSNRFVEDYGPLTDRLREVVQMSKKL